MNLVAHPSPVVLEHELLDRVAAAKSTDALAPVLIVVGSRRLADHVKRRLVERFGAILGVSVLHHRALAARILEAAGVAVPRLLGDDLEATLFAGVLHRAPAGPLRDFVRDHPGAASAMRDALTDLREAGIDPAAAAEVLSGPETETAVLYARWSSALDQGARHGNALDDAGIVRAATEHAGGFASQFSAILHHGAYDLIGVRVEFVRALDRVCEVTFLLPAETPSAGFDREAAPADVTFLHAQGARAELSTAAYEALAAVGSGTRPEEVAIVVRSWGPYLNAMDALFDRAGTRWHTSYTQPLRRDPAAGAALRAIEADTGSGGKSFAAHADDFAELARAAPPSAPIEALLQSMRDVEGVLGDRHGVSRSEARAWITMRSDAATIPPVHADEGGIRILDAMQARGLTFSEVRLLGLNAGIFPRVAAEHPFLSDLSRARLRSATGSPLPIAGERDGEERLLLAMMLRAPRDRIGVSWLRADESARPSVPSLALREIARFADRGSGACDPEREARAVPVHPRARLTAWAESPGLLSPHDELVLTALSSELGSPAASAIVTRRPEWSHGVRLVEATERFDTVAGPYDGRIEASVLGETIAATALERLGRCPLQFFFRHGLRIDDGDRDGDPLAIDRKALGIRVHAALATVYTTLLDEGAFASAGLPARIERAHAVLRDAWNASVDAATAARAVRLPMLDRIESALWLRALGAFLTADLTRMAAARQSPVHLEHEIDGKVPGSAVGVPVRARLDRIVENDEGRTVGDYKIGGRLEEKTKSAAMLSGTSLQVPIYALLTGLPVELIGVGPDHAGEPARFPGFKAAAERAGVVETVDAVLGLARAGRFPIRPDDHCAWCGFRSACRHGHPPTIFRDAHAADVQDARDCWSKTAKTPLLADVRRGRT